MDKLRAASSLSALHNSGERFDPPKCHKNTRLGVLKRLMDWFTGEFGSDMFVLWLYGPAGVGKSSIAQTLAEKAAETHNLLASFFFSRSDPRRNNAQTLVATLAYQMTLNIPDLRPILQSVVCANPGVFDLSFQTQFQTLVIEPLLQLSETGFFSSEESYPSLIIIDGLDECTSQDDKRAILETITQAFTHHRSALPFKVLIASRPEHHLSTSFSLSSLNSMTFRVLLDADADAYEDIRTYLTAEFDNIRKNHILGPHLPSSWPSMEEIDQLVKQSSAQFIYAATIIRYVSSSRLDPIERLKVINGLLPVENDHPYAQLDALYLNILSQVQDTHTTLRTLAAALILHDVYDQKRGDSHRQRIGNFYATKPRKAPATLS